MMKKELVKIWMWAIIPVALTLIFLVTVSAMDRNTWINVSFVWVAYLTASASCLSRWGKGLAILEWASYLCAVSYLGAELLVAVAFLYFYTDVPQWAFSVQLLLYVVYVLLCGLMYLFNRTTEEQMNDFK